MARVSVVTVLDPAAAEIAGEALDEIGIPYEIEPVRLENPYVPSALAGQLRIFVPAERLADAKGVLDTLALEVAGETETQAWGPDGAASSPPGSRAGAGAAPPASLEERPRRVSWALTLAFFVPFPVSSIYARTRLGAVLLTCFAALLLAMIVTAPSGEGPHLRADLAWALMGVKAVDPVIAVAVILLRRGRPPAGTA